MRRQDIQLRLLAKRGDPDARLRLGESYLNGSTGFARNVAVGLTYLRAAMAQTPQAAVCVAQHLELQEIIEHDQLDVLKLAAERCDVARLKLAAWQLVCGEQAAARTLLDRIPNLMPSVPRREVEGSVTAVGAVLQAIRALVPMDIAEVVLRAARGALDVGDFSRTVNMLESLPEPHDALPIAVMQLIVDVVRHAETHNLSLGSLPIGLLEVALDRCSSAGDIYACHTLGRALAGIKCGSLPAERLATSPQLRKAAALLLRAADGKTPAAWLHLYRICSDYRGSVANPMMARFCLEKAAHYGIADAERRLGALELREAMGIEAMERAVGLVFQASRKGDPVARTILQSLVLPVDGLESEAQSAIHQVQRDMPLLAMRLRLARHFGLTKLEALSLNPTAGKRPWGLVVGKNPFVVKLRLAEPRAVPATSDAALDCLDRAASMFSVNEEEPGTLEAPLRSRSQQQRRLFERMGLRDDLFFSSATSQQRDAIRVGTKWAQKQRQTLQMALAD